MMNVPHCRIKGATCRTCIANRDVTVVFRSPYRWRIYDNGKDVTKEFGHALRGPTLPEHSPEWYAFHTEAKHNEKDCLLHI